MIALNETVEYAAEVPFTLPTTANPLVGLTSWAFTLGEVQIKLPGAGAWTNVQVSKIVEKGYGRYAARLTSLQTTVAGVVAIRATVSGAQPYFGYDTIGTLGGDISLNGTGYIPFFLPNSTDPVYGSPITGANFTTTGLLRICLPNASYRDATFAEAAAVVELGGGGYAFVLGTTLTATRGKVYLYVEYPGAQRFECFSTILGVAAAVTTPPPTPTPIPSPIAVIDPMYVAHLNRAIDRLPQQFKSGILVDEATTLDMLLGGEL